jgi:hypothetical protein
MIAKKPKEVESLTEGGANIALAKLLRKPPAGG